MAGKHFLSIFTLFFSLMKPIIFLLFSLFFNLFLASAQVVVETPPPNYIRTVIFSGPDELPSTPIIELGASIRLQFDDIIGDEANYYYRIEHFNYNWTPSDLLKNEYLEGFDNMRITSYENSYNTLQIYSNYSLQIPNNNTRSLKVSGNYMLKIFNEAQELVFSRKFMVYEPITSVRVAIKKSREVALIPKKQVVNFEVESPNLVIRNSQENISAVILQNQNLKTGIYDVKPQYTLGTSLIFKYDQLTSFWGGNEFHSFDSKDLRAATVKIKRVEVQELYHHYLFRDKIRALEPYTYNPDINGSFVVRKYEAMQDSDIEAEYIWTHFFLETFQPIEEGEVHLYGRFNNYELDDSTRLTYNYLTGTYENALLFKQGFYDYKYVLVGKNGELDEGFISGNSVNTENDYSVLIYYRPPGGRYTQIIGYGHANSQSISN